MSITQFKQIQEASILCRHVQNNACGFTTPVCTTWTAPCMRVQNLLILSCSTNAAENLDVFDTSNAGAARAGTQTRPKQFGRGSHWQEQLCRHMARNPSYRQTELTDYTASQSKTCKYERRVPLWPESIRADCEALALWLSFAHGQMSSACLHVPLISSDYE